METVGLIGMLVVCSIEDFRRKEMHLMVLLGFGIVGIVLQMFYRSRSIYEILGGMLIGGILLIFSYASDGKIGKGDGILMMVTGIYLGFWNNLLLLWCATALAGIVGLSMFCVKRERNLTLPFAPFVLLVCATGCMVQALQVV